MRGLGGGAPVAVTLNVTPLPSQAICEFGGTVTAGKASTVSVAGLLVAAPQELVTTTS